MPKAMLCIFKCSFMVNLRELRDIIKSLKPIVDVLLLLLFIVFVFALLGKWDKNLTSFALCHQTIMFIYLHRLLHIR